MTLDSRLATRDSITHRAGWVVIDPGTVIRDGFVEVDGELIKDVGQGRPKTGIRVIDHGPGALMPVLVNAHTHLELCSLKGKVPFGQGFRTWVQALLRQREMEGAAAIRAGAEAGTAELFEAGCGVLGEISTLGLTWETVLNSGLSGVWFREFLGGALSAELACRNEKKKVMASVAGHAPHTVAPDILQHLKAVSRENTLPFSIHAAESEDEMQFLATGSGPWADFLTERGIDFSTWGLPAGSPVAYLERLGILDENTLLVHLIHAGPRDFERLRKFDVQVCLCLRSNTNLHRRMPDLPGMLQAGLTPCLGTDSLASVPSLSIFDEMAWVCNSFASVPPAKILAMATLNGARALQASRRFGSLVPGKYGMFVYVPVRASTPSGLLEAIVTADFDGPTRVVPEGNGRRTTNHGHSL